MVTYSKFIKHNKPLMDTPLSSRKSDHIRINLENNVQSGVNTGLDRYQFIHQALPELDMGEIDLSQTLFTQNLDAPILISSMTGGTAEAKKVNQILAEAAQHTKIAMGVGSQRAAIEHPELASTFQIRQYAPDILLFANLGAIQLNYTYTIDQCKRAVEMISANALVLHLNPLQEALQPEGDTNFSGLLVKIEKVCRQLEVPVIVKEVGWGISDQAAQQLTNAGVSAIDVAGAGGTSWSQVEMHRIQDEIGKRVASAFRNWGIPTSTSILMVRKSAPNLLIFASGGLRDGIDIAKCIALGATLGGMAGMFLKAASKGIEDTINTIQQVRKELQICMFATGAATISALQRIKLLAVDEDHYESR